MVCAWQTLLYTHRRIRSRSSEYCRLIILCSSFWDRMRLRDLDSRERWLYQAREEILRGCGEICKPKLPPHRVTRGQQRCSIGNGTTADYNSQRGPHESLTSTCSFEVLQTLKWRPPPRRSGTRQPSCENTLRLVDCADAKRVCVVFQAFLYTYLYPSQFAVCGTVSCQERLGRHQRANGDSSGRRRS